MLQAELDHHLAQERNAGEIKSNYKNGSSKKTVLASQDKIELNILRDREGDFDPQLIAKHQRRLPGFDDKVISLYARGLPVREIQGHLTELYGLEVSPDLISKVTSGVMDEVIEWQNRPLEPVYPLVFFDALRVKIRDEGSVKNKAVYLALGVRPDGLKGILGIWVEQTEGAKFWLRVMTELKNRGVTDILIAVIDGLKGFPEAITAAFPQTQIQTKRLKPSPIAHGGSNIRPLLQFGNVIGKKLFRFSATPWRFVKSSIQRMPLKVCICACVR